MNMTCHSCARTWEIDDDATAASCAFCGREHDAAMIATSRAAVALGSISTPKKAAASAANGKRGGRPKMKLVTVRYPRTLQANASWRKLEKRFFKSDSALTWAREADETVSRSYGNGWPREFLIDGKPVIGPENVQW